MSRIGKLPVKIPQNVEIKVDKNHIIVKGPKGELELDVRPEITIKTEENQIILERTSEEKSVRAFHGLSRALLANLIIGVTDGFKKELEIQGVGYKAEGGGNQITLHLGFSHPIKLNTPSGINIELDKTRKNTLIITGIDKQKVGHFAAIIREHRKPEPYKGKGIRYVGEEVARKAGKKTSK